MRGHRRRARWRPAFVLLSVLVLAGVFLVRLTDVQVVRADALRTASKDRRSITTVLPGPRGDIVDAGGKVKLTVTHSDLGDKALKDVSGGWPAVLSNLKTLLETGRTIPDPFSGVGNHPKG